MKFRFWFGLGFGFDRRLNRHHDEEIYMVMPFLKIRIYLNPHKYIC
jgi:hypothetical protein